MRAVTFQAPGEVRVDDVPEPELAGPSDAIVRIEATGVRADDADVVLPGHLNQLRVVPAPGVVQQVRALFADGFAHLVARGRIERAAPFDIERRHGDHVDLPRLRFAFRRHRSGDLRALIDAVNGFVSPVGARAPE